MKILIILFALAVVGLAAAAGFVYSGVYDIGADAPHWPLTFDLVETLRERSVAARIEDIKPPDLNDPKLVADGAEHYSAMCTGCHLAPGMDDTELRKGLYPQPPKLADPWPADPRGQFWAIKHGIKLTAMPAWGATHDDNSIWGLVAFLQKLQGMTPAVYAAMTGDAGGNEHAEQQHHHGDAEGSGQSDHPHEHE